MSKYRRLVFIINFILGLNFAAVCPDWRPILVGESAQLEAVEGKFPGADVLLGVVHPRAFAKMGKYRKGLEDFLSDHHQFNATFS